MFADVYKPLPHLRRLVAEDVRMGAVVRDWRMLYLLAVNTAYFTGDK